MTETTELHFWGHSDDLIEVEGDIEGADEYPYSEEGSATR